ncbi:MAG: histidine phosphatase family protein [Sphingomonadales bacterium]
MWVKLIAGAFAILLGLVVASGEAAWAAEKIYLVRHAEKVADGTTDPELTRVGKGRACFLARFFKAKGLTEVRSSEYRRTMGTANPVARALGIPLSIYDPSELPVLAMDLKHRDGVPLIVGHSNTTPQLARLLGARDVEDMEGNEYDRVIEIDYTGGEAKMIVHRSEAYCLE